jgi:hypothetical protein
VCPRGAARVLRPDRLALVIEHVGHDEDVGVASEPALLSHVRFKYIEPARGIHLQPRGELLLMGTQDVMLEKRLRDLGEGLVIERLRQIDASDLGAQMLATYGSRGLRLHPLREPAINVA